MSTIECFIQDVVTAVPDKWLDTQSGTQLLAQACTDERSARLMKRVMRLTGISRRYLAALDYQPEGDDDRWLYQPAQKQPKGPGMGERTEAFHKSADQLVRKLLEQLPAGCLARVDNLVTASCTHASAPGLELPVFMHTAVPPSVSRWNLGFMGCSAGLAGMRLMHETAAFYKTSLVLACELSSLHFQYTDQIDQMTANVLFADGAAAMILSPQPSPARVIACRCVTLPLHASQMVWMAADHGLKLQLSQELPDTLAAHLPGALSSFLDSCNSSIRDIKHWLVHPGGPQILDSVQKCLGLDEHAMDLSRAVLRDYGNMSSPTIFFILKELLASRPQGRAIAMAFGPGLTIELVLLSFE